MTRIVVRLLAAAAVALTVRASVPLAAAPSTWVNVTGNLAGMPSECGNLTLVSSIPGANAVTAGVAARGLWTNSTGATWVALGSGAGSDTMVHRPSWIAYDPTDARIFWESGIYNGGGAYKTSDGGSTFHRLGSITHNDFISVDFSDPNRRTLLAGGHEQSRTVYRSVDGGQTWTNIGATIPANTKFNSNPIFIDAQTYVVDAQGWGSGTGGLFRTTNGGASWQQVTTMEPSYPPPLVASNGAIYWPSGSTLLKSTDAGVTWTRVGGGLQNIHPIELPGGRLASVGGNSIVMSSDGGTTWQPIGATLPYAPAGLVYSVNRRAFFIWHWDCGSVVLPDAIMMLDLDVSGTAPSPPTGLRISPQGD
jgi:hypothetical protein